MTENTITGIAMSIVIFLIGISFLLSGNFAEWSINNTRAGQRWERIFGEDRGVWILRFIVSPLLILMSLACFWLSLSGKIG